MERRLEFGLIYLAGPLVGYAIVRWQPHAVIPLLLLGGGVAWWMLARDPSFNRREWGWNGVARSAFMRILLVWSMVTVGLVTWALWAVPEQLLRFPKEQTRSWLVFLALYPALSAWPQELLFRSLFIHRYGALFKRQRERVIANGLLFGWAHIVMDNLPSLLATTALGFLLAWTYERCRSVLVVTLEHALYGCVVFSLGLGIYFIPVERKSELIPVQVPAINDHRPDGWPASWAVPHFESFSGSLRSCK